MSVLDESGALTPEALAFVTERRLETLTTLRPDGSPHVVPVGFTWEPADDGGAVGSGGRPVLGTARVTMRAASRKARNVLAAGPEGTPVSICSFEGRWWVTLEGRAVLSTDPEVVADAVARYAVRYERTPAPDPGRGAVLVRVDRVMGNLRGR